MNSNIYFKSLLNKNIYLDLKNVNNNLENNILTELKSNFEGLCTNDGYIKTNSINILTYSSGIITNNIKFNVIFECLICYPVEGMKIQCIVKNITKAGLRCQLNNNDTDDDPMVIFIAKDHHFKNKNFNDIVENDIINAKIIGQRFELNDKYISVIATFIDKK